jgi:transposase InsO family protein
MGKHHRDSFPVGKSWRATKPLELVHADICGPMQTLSLNKNKYFIIFLDDFSRITWVYFIKEKYDALIIFQQFKVVVEKKSGYVLKTLHTDRGGEFTSNDFGDY